MNYFERNKSKRLWETSAARLQTVHLTVTMIQLNTTMVWHVEERLFVSPNTG